MTRPQPKVIINEQYTYLMFSDVPEIAIQGAKKVHRRLGRGEIKTARFIKPYNQKEER